MYTNLRFNEGRIVITKRRLDVEEVFFMFFFLSLNGYLGQCTRPDFMKFDMFIKLIISNFLMQ